MKYEVLLEPKPITRTISGVEEVDNEGKVKIIAEPVSFEATIGEPTVLELHPAQVKILEGQGWQVKEVKR
jgi:hypothetical protein